ncbi:MAG: 4-hydroxybenzoate octaprenyltransferase [Alphaproteobacteria bacterium]
MSDTAAHTDLAPSHWLLKLLPSRMRPYAVMARMDRPIGWWLLLLPTWFGISAAWAAGKARPTFALDWVVPLRPYWLDGALAGLVDLLPLYGLMWLGAIVMRGAGCTINDLLDRNLDARVARTAGRPLPSGQVTVLGAVLFLILQLAIGLTILLQLPPQAIAIAIMFTPLVFLYPLAKRLTHWPQVVLGIVFNAGVPIGWAAASASFPGLSGADLGCWVLYLGCILWCVGYDSIYAIQDREDDLTAGVKSTATRFGDRIGNLVFVCYSVATALFATALAVLSGIWWCLFLVAPVSTHFKLQMLRLDPNDGPLALKLFKSNRNTGLILLAMILIAGWIAA